MNLSCILLPLGFVGLLVAGCHTTWPQFHADEANTGFGNADGPQRAPRFKWKTEIGDVRYASPVIAGDGTAYIGNLRGTLFAIDKNGNIKWKFDAREENDQKCDDYRYCGTTIESSAAIDGDGNIYFMSTNHIGSLRFTSKLFSLRPDGFLRWEHHDFPIDQFSTASPKVILTSGFGKNIFVYFRPYDESFDEIRGAQLWIFDEYGRPIHREGLECPGGDYHKGWDPRFHPGLDPRLTDKWGISSHNNIDARTLMDPSVAIIKARQTGQLIVIVASNFCAIHAFRWEPSYENIHTNHGLVPLWSQPMSGLLLSSATVFSDNVVVVGTSNNLVLGFDLFTGKRLFQYDAREPVLGTAATSSVQLGFITSIQHVSNVRFLNWFKLPGFTVGSPALSNGAVYVTDDEGLHLLGLDLKWAITEGIYGGHTTSSPAIGPDGTLYVVLDRSLVAFGP